jgi:hypothetical protein
MHAWILFIFQVEIENVNYIVDCIRCSGERAAEPNSPTGLTLGTIVLIWH